MRSPRPSPPRRCRRAFGRFTLHILETRVPPAIGVVAESTYGDLRPRRDEPRPEAVDRDRLKPVPVDAGATELDTQDRRPRGRAGGREHEVPERPGDERAPRRPRHGAE